jgi:hypothetical protein
MVAGLVVHRATDLQRLHPAAPAGPHRPDLGGGGPGGARLVAAARLPAHPVGRPLHAVADRQLPAVQPGGGAAVFAPEKIGAAGLRPMGPGFHGGPGDHRLKTPLGV